MLYPVTSRLGIWVCVLALVGLVTASSADTITIKDVKYENVLVSMSKTGSLYYVTIPTQGRVISVAKDQVDPAAVSISDDPYYRDDLKSQYNLARKNISEGKSATEGQNFSVAIQEGPSGGAGGGSFLDSGGRGMGKTLGVTLYEIKGAMEKAGFTFTGEGMVIEGKSRDGKLTVQLHALDDELTAIIAETSGVSMIPLVQRVAQLAPALAGIKRAQWSAPWMQQNVAEVFKFNTIERAAQGVYIAMEPSRRNGAAVLKVTIRGV